MKKFWFVWNPSGRAPTYKHETKTSARKEAERLAEANPGQAFIVLESCGHCCTRKPTEWTKHENQNEATYTMSVSGDWAQEEMPF